MFWWFAGPTHKNSVTFQLALNLTAQAQSSAILSGIPTSLPPLNWARSPRGEVIFANGIIPMSKWNGIRPAARSVGVPAPLTAPVIIGIGGGTISGLYQVYQRWLDDDGNPSNLSPVSNTLDIDVASPVQYINASNLDAPLDPKITRRQVLRNTAGQLLVFYAEVDTTDLVSTAFPLTLSDNDLATKEAVPLFDASNQPLANRFGIPPSWMRAIAVHRSRAFAAATTSYSDGSIELTNGSTSVQGVGTNWIVTFIGRTFYVQGDSTAYQIQNVNPATQVITLTTAYPGAPTFFSNYKITPPPAEKNLVYFSEADSYDAWSASNALAIEENGDEITALISNESFLYILQRRHTFRLSYLNSPFPSPVGDGAIFPTNTRGAVNQRCVIQIDGDIYSLDEQGVYSSSGNKIEPFSMAIQNIFWIDRTDLLNTDYRINWEAQEFFHAQNNYEETTVRWYVALSGDRLPQHALCFNYRSQQWWLEEYAYPVGGSGQSLDPSSKPLVCGPSKKILFTGVGTTDGADPRAGTTRAGRSRAPPGRASRIQRLRLRTGLVGEPVVIFDGAGKTEIRIIASVSGQTVNVTQPFTIHLDTTSEYQLGGIPWNWRSGWYRWARGPEGESSNSRRIEAIFEPCKKDAQMDLRIYVDHSATPKPWSQNYPTTPKEYVGITIAKGSPDLVVGLNWNKGFAQVRMDGHRDQFLNQADVVSLEMRGVSAENVVRIYQVALEGAE